MASFERHNGVAHSRFVEVDAQVFTVHPDFSHQGMAREPPVNLSHQFNGRPDAIRVRLAVIELIITMVCIDLPGVNATVYGSTSEQSGAVAA